MLAHPEAELGPDVVAAFEAALERRAAGEPIAYIRGFKEWHSLRIRTDRRALIPRPETELLADATIAEIARRLATRRCPRRRLGGRHRFGRGGGRDCPASSPGARGRSCDAHRERRLGRGARAGCREPGRSPRREPRDDGLRRPAGAGRRPAPAAGRRGRQPSLRHDGRGRRPPRVARVRAAHRRRRWAGRAGPPAPALRRPAVRAPPPARPCCWRSASGQVEAISALVPPGASVAVVPDLAGLDRVVRIGLEAPA